MIVLSYDYVMITLDNYSHKLSYDCIQSDQKHAYFNKVRQLRLTLKEREKKKI